MNEPPQVIVKTLPYPRLRPDGDPDCPLPQFNCACGRTVFCNWRIQGLGKLPPDQTWTCHCGRNYRLTWEWFRGL